MSDIHPTVPNPYTLLSSLLPEYTWYIVLDLKDAFFSLPLAAQSQEIFAFKWTDGSTINLDPPPTGVQELPYLG